MSERASQARSAEERSEWGDERLREERVGYSERASQARSVEERSERGDERLREERVGYSERASQARSAEELPRLLPDVNDPVSAPFWAGLRRRMILVQRCCACGALRYPPLAGCPECLSRAVEWVEVGPAGSVWSYAIYHRALQPAFAGEIPYTVAVVELDNGPRITARMVRGSGPVVIGARVTAQFEDVSAEVTQLKWRLA